ncbi:MAG: hypothetical protein F8N37_11980 [Telmatospirillum sp.]|nr:hypothetical protein [Telmatospirillum sp.]
MTGIDPGQLMKLVIRPTLTAIGLGGPAAEQLMLGTAAQESRCGRYLAQIGGPALGPWQMEPATHDDLWTNTLTGKPDLAARVKALLPATCDRRQQLVTNLAYACAMARLVYWRAPASLPPAGDIEAQAAFYKRFYNTPAGAATVGQYISNWHAATDGQPFA